MKFLHTADLHIGKKLFENSLLEDQRHILQQIIEIACREKVDAVLIAGDVYDRAVPSTDAVELLDSFLTELVEKRITVIAISGNHDSPERVSFADKILEHQGLHIAGHYTQPLKTVTLQDEFGPVTFVSMPFVKSAVTGNADSVSAVRQMLEDFPEEVRKNHRYVLLTHFFVVGENGEAPELSDSETDVNVGGLDSVPVSLFQGFSYVAMGHIHRPQHIGTGNAYYSGSPLKYSFSEALGEKYVNLVELGKLETDSVTVDRIPLKPLHEMRCIRGTLQQLMSSDVLAMEENSKDDYLQVTLTDTEELIDPIGTLRSVYPNVLQILLEKNKELDDAAYESRLHSVKKDTVQLFTEFYELIKGEPMDELRLKAVKEAVTEAEKVQ